MAALETKQQVILDVTIKGSPGYLYGKIGVIDVCYLACNSKANAEKTKDALDGLPSEFFLRTVMTHSQENRHFLAVERYEESLSAHIERGPKLYQRKEIVRNLIEMGICLDKLMLIHGNLSMSTMVMFKGKLKSFSIPVPEVETNASTQQAKQLYDIARSVIPPIPPLPVNGNLSPEESVQRDFFEKLKTCFSGVDLAGILCHPFLMTLPAAKLSYHASCMLILRSTDYNQIKLNFNHSYPSYPTDSTNDWRKKVELSGSDNLKNVYYKNSYSKSTFDKHRCIRNITQHANDEQKRTIDIHEVQQEFEKLFPTYLMEMHTYMHEYDMNAYLDNHIRGEATLLQLFRNEMSKILGGVVENLKFDSTTFLKCFKMIDFFLVKMNSYCLACVPMIHTIREKIQGHLKALGNIETLDGQLFLHIINDLGKTEKVSMISLLRYIHALLRCLQLLLNDKTTKTSSAVEVVLPECKNQNQAIDVPRRSKVMKVIQVQHLSSKEILVLQQQLQVITRNLWTLGHIDEARATQNHPAPWNRHPATWRGGTSHS